MTGRSWWRIFFVAVCVAWWLQKLVWSNPGNQWDFRVYYHGAQAWTAGFDPYDPASLPADLSRGGFKFNYPPYALGLFAPITLIPLKQALLLYLALKLIVLVWLVQLWSRLLRTSVMEPAWILFLIFGYSSTIFVDFASGSVTTFEQALVWLGVAGLLTGRPWTYVAAVVGASLFRLTPILLLPACLAVPRRGYRYVAAGAAAFAAIFLLTYAASPRLTVEFFQSIPKNYGERGWLNPAALPLVQDVAAVIGRAHGGSLMPAVEAALYLAVAGAIVVPTAVVVRRVAGTGARNRMELIVYLAFLANALVLPRFKNYSYMLVLVPTFYIATRSTRLHQAFPLLLLACLPVYSWITRAENIDLLANYSQWLIALGAWGLYMYELHGGALLEPDGALATNDQYVAAGRAT
jgi:Glycosyltransferase family 87